MKKYSIFFGAACLLLWGAAPAAHAAVFITEIMYDPSGAQSGREWVEITNTGSQGVDLSGYKFFENNTNHGLTLVIRGSMTLAPQASAVLIATSTDAVFMTDYPSFSGTLIKTSFSLSDGGESIAIKSSSASIPDDTVSYTAYITQSASGHGDSLHCINDVCAAGAPTPGVFLESGSGDGGGSPGSDAGDSSSTPAVDVTPLVATGGSPAPAMTVDAGGDRTVETGAGSFFEGHMYSKDGVPLQNVRYLWNFGDGETSDQSSVFYAYPYPGKYVVLLSADAGDGYSAIDRMVVEAVPAEVAVAQKDDGSLLVSNTTHTKKELNLGMWKLERGGGLFVIPRNTIVLPGMAVRFAPNVLKLPTGTSTLLLYPDNMVAAHTDDLVMSDAEAAGISYEPISPVPAAASPAKKTASAPVSVVEPVPPTDTTVSVSAGDHMVIRRPSNQSPVPAVITEVPAVGDTAPTATPEVADVAEPAPVAAAARAPIPGELSPGMLSAAGTSALVLLGAAGALYARPRSPRVPADTVPDTSLSDEENLELESEDPELVPDKEALLRRADRLAQDFTIRDTTKE